MHLLPDLVDGIPCRRLHMALANMVRNSLQSTAGNEGPVAGRTPLPSSGPAAASREEMEAAQLLVDQARSGGEVMGRLNALRGRDGPSVPKPSDAPTSASSVTTHRDPVASASPQPRDSAAEKMPSSRPKASGEITGQVCKWDTPPPTHSLARSAVDVIAHRLLVTAGLQVHPFGDGLQRERRYATPVACTTRRGTVTDR